VELSGGHYATVVDRTVDTAAAAHTRMADAVTTTTDAMVAGRPWEHWALAAVGSLARRGVVVVKQHGVDWLPRPVVVAMATAVHCP
jgi:hypothetical protein